MNGGRAGPSGRNDRGPAPCEPSRGVSVHSTLRNAPALLRTPLGRLQLLDETLDWAWPAFRGLASLYRRTLVRNTCLVAVVGSFGKSSTARAVVAALGGTPHRHIVFNTRSYVALAVFRIRPGQRHAVLEVGINGPGQMARHARTVEPEITVVTSVGSEHNRALKTLDWPSWGSCHGG